MTIIKRDPFVWPRELNSVFNQFLRNTADDESTLDTSMWTPAVDIKEADEQFEVLADLPGVNSKDIHLSIENNVLTIKGERNYEKSEEQEGYKRVERMQGEFYRRFSLPETADGERITAESKQGVLKVVIPKKVVAQSKKIEVKAAD